jgi:hypothetical protein
MVADELQVHARVVGGTPGDVLTVTAVAGTTSRELSTASARVPTATSSRRPAAARRWSTSA